MSDKEVFEFLCYYDERSPDYDPDSGPRPKDCHCDNCFYGRHQLAIALLEAAETTRELEELVRNLKSLVSKGE